MNRSVRYFTYAKMLSLAGLWHTQTYRQRLLRYYVIGFASLYCIFAQLCQLYASSFDLMSAIRLLKIFVPTVCSTAMYWPCIFHFKKIKQIYSYILQDTLVVDDDTELSIMKKYAHYANLYTFTSAAMIYTHLTMNITSSLLRMILSTNAIRSDLDLFPVISCFDYFSNRETYYYPIIMYQTITYFALITTSVACYANLMTFLLHACARLSIIKYRIHSPFNCNIHKDDVKEIDFCPWIIDIVKCLVRTTEFMTSINTVFEKSYLFQMSVGFIHLMLDFLCIPILIENKTNTKDVLELIIYIFGTLFMTYIYCYVGQRLLDYSLDVYREACLVPFHEMSLKTQKLLLITLMMSAKPYTVSIGKVFVASHEFFSNLVRNALSFAMVVYSLQDI